MTLAIRWPHDPGENQDRSPATGPMTLAISWPHHPGENAAAWPHDPGDRHAPAAVLPLAALRADYSCWVTVQRALLQIWLLVQGWLQAPQLAGSVRGSMQRSPPPSALPLLQQMKPVGQEKAQLPLTQAPSTQAWSGLQGLPQLPQWFWSFLVSTQ
jgi:hypothetical protein